jgi:hypothetical protein
MTTTKILGATLVLLFVTASTLQACTISVLTDDDGVLFCNTEDWSNPKTRIWFVPGGEGYFGCAYVGFDNGCGQGGLNTKGLAYDWVMTGKETWNPSPDLKIARGIPAERMLETCASVADAVAFYRTHYDPSFSASKILIADSTGASVIIGAKDGKLEVKKSYQSLGFGYGQKQLSKLLPKSPEPTVSNAIKLLQACLQKGQYATKYANVFDLKSGDIFLFPNAKPKNPVRFNLTKELAKGGHFYDIPKIHQQMTQPPKPLLNNIKRFVFDQYKPISVPDPNTTQHIRDLFRNARAGQMKAQNYTEELWKEVEGNQEKIKAELKQFGKLTSIVPVEYSHKDGQYSYRYIVDLEQIRLLMYMVLDSQNKLMVSETEAFEMKATSKGK